jgi:hypothetical protein
VCPCGGVVCDGTTKDLMFRRRGWVRRSEGCEGESEEEENDVNTVSKVVGTLNVWSTKEEGLSGWETDVGRQAI